MEALDKWLDNMLESLKTDSSLTSIHDYFHIIQVIYTCCLQELIRQVSLDCKDRGLLLKKIWNAYITILENAIFEEIKTQQHNEREYLEEITKVHKIYQQEIENNKNFVETTREENLKLAEIAKNYKENQKFLKKAYRHFEKDYKLMKRDLEYSLNEQKVLIDENNRLKKLLEAQADEKDQKSQGKIGKMDNLFKNAADIQESPEKTLAEIEQRHAKSKRRAKTVQKNQRKSVLQQWKLLENQEKAVDTGDLVIVWDTEVNTDIVYGNKKLVFLEKFTQTLDRNQFLRESRINEEEIEQILKENRNFNRNIERPQEILRESHGENEEKLAEFEEIGENQMIPSELLQENDRSQIKLLKKGKNFAKISL